MEKILVTGNQGYIGIILTEELLKNGYDVIGIDTNFYNDKYFYDFKLNKDINQIKKDIRNINLEDLKGINAIIHLAALSNDPLGELNPNLTDIINFQSSIKLAKLAKKAKISRYLFSSSCSVYGGAKKQILTENSPLNPLSAYAVSKVKVEKGLSKLSNSEFSPVFLRNATAFGSSPNMRFDLVVNNLMGWGYTTKEINILSDGKAWRPNVHIRDISNAFIAVLKASRDEIHNEVFNVGQNSENYQVKDIAQEIENVMTDCEIKILGKDNPDQRNYNVNFDKIKTKLKNFKPEWTLKKGIIELFKIFEKVNLTYDMFQNKKFTRLKQLKYLLENKLIDENLFWL